MQTRFISQRHLQLVCVYTLMLTALLRAGKEVKPGDLATLLAMLVAMQDLTERMAGVYKPLNTTKHNALLGLALCMHYGFLGGVKGLVNFNMLINLTTGLDIIYGLFNQRPRQANLPNRQERVEQARLQPRPD